MQTRTVYLWNAKIYGDGGLLYSIVVGAESAKDAEEVARVWSTERQLESRVRRIDASRKLVQREQAWVILPE